MSASNYEQAPVVDDSHIEEGNDLDQQVLPARIFGSPKRYIQAQGAINNIGEYLLPMGIKQVGVLLSARSQLAEGGALLAGLEEKSIGYQLSLFAGECSYPEIDKHVSAIQKNAQTVDAYIAIGGGKVVDAGKCIAHRLKVPVIVVPSLASNDAPCSALSVIYSPEGVVAAVEFFPENPALVLVDTGVVAAAEARHLVAGIGDAMATWYEARVCAENKRATNALGGRPTLAGTAIAELCAKTIFEDGLAAVEAVQASIVTDELERVVEANILLSGVGFESGGLALAHGLASGYTVVSHVHKHFLHGEMVAMGLLTQLVIEDRIDEAREVGQFFIKVGLPVHLGQLGLEATNMEELNAIVRNTLTSAIVANMPFEVTETALLSALLAADKLGLEITAADGDEAYRQLQA